MNDKLTDALSEVKEEYIAEAAAHKRRPYWLGAVAAVLAAAVLISIIGGTGAPPAPTDPALENPGTTSTAAPSTTAPSTTAPFETTVPTIPEVIQLANQVAAPVPPPMAAYPTSEDPNYRDAFDAWYESQRQQYDQPEGYADTLGEFFTASIRQFLSGDDNCAYSPVNVYMALAMLARSAQGESRQQILDLLAADSMDALTEQAGHVWNAHYSDDGISTLRLANSLWLSNNSRFEQSTVDDLAQNFFASTFHGDLNTDALNDQLRQWLNDNTGNLLTEHTQSVRFPEKTVAALASTIYFRACWDSDFAPQNTANEPFYTARGEKTVPFMHRDFSPKTYYRGKDYGAIALEMSGSNTMWLILPDENSSTAQVLDSSEFMTMVRAPRDWNKKKNYELELSLPKFDVHSNTNLIDGLKQLGVTDVFDPEQADLFGLVTPDSVTDNVYISKADHAARVSIDEDGCEAAAYTVMFTVPSSAPSDQLEQLSFILNRPFIFVITSRDNLPLFAGIVNNP